MSCQLKLIDEIKEKNSIINNIFQLRTRLLRATKRKTKYYVNKILRLVTSKKDQRIASGLTNNRIVAGDKVTVKSKIEIKKMLNEHEKYKGCLFIDEMYEYCDEIHTVLKEVKFFFDEAKQSFCKCNDMVILEGVTCSGRQRIYSVSCDRQCFFYWHKAWLKKL